jgi:DNA-binding SARP family transcriptional activator
VFFRVLGPIEVTDGAVDLTPSAPKLREVLALLVLHANRLVRTNEFIDELWRGNPPVSAAATLQTYIYKLRKLGPFRDCDGAGGYLLTRPGGYQVNIPADAIDLHVFERLLRRAEDMMDTDPQQASDVLSEALDLWRGPTLADVELGEALTAYAHLLEEQRLRAVQLRVEADLKLGRHAELVSKLRELTAIHLFHEGFHSSLMLALYRSGRCFEALEVYRRLRENMIDELGLEPSPALRQLQRAMINSDPALDRRPHTPARTAPLCSPAQLPPTIFEFTGRGPELSLMERLLTEAGDRRSAVRMVRIAGMPGVGKTELAVEAAHRAADHFPGGQLVADLRGSTGTPREPGEVLGEFLHATGFPMDRVPASVEERAKLFRSWSSANPVLVLLDDAASAAQVMPLLPANSRSAVVITSRARLTGLGGTVQIDLAPLPMEDAVKLLCRSMGLDRTPGDRAPERLAMLCGRLPLAIRCVGSRLAMSGPHAVTTLADRAEQAARLLEVLQADEIRQRLASHYDRLTEVGRSTFRSLGLLPARFATSHACQLLTCADWEIEMAMRELVGQSLLRRLDGDHEDPVYVQHELVRSFARECYEAQTADQGLVSLS